MKANRSDREALEVMADRILNDREYRTFLATRAMIPLALRVADAALHLAATFHRHAKDPRIAAMLGDGATLRQDIRKLSRLAATLPRKRGKSDRA
jgi:hypothetical protein